LHQVLVEPDQPRAIGIEGRSDFREGGVHSGSGIGPGERTTDREERGDRIWGGR